MLRNSSYDEIGDLDNHVAIDEFLWTQNDLDNFTVPTQVDFHKDISLDSLSDKQCIEYCNYKIEKSSTYRHFE